MKKNIFYSTDSGQVVRQLGFGFDFSTSYYVKPLVSRRARFSVSFSRLSPILVIMSAGRSIVKVLYRAANGLFDAFKLVLSSPIH